MEINQLSPLAGIVLFSLLGGGLSVFGAALVALNISRAGVPMLISYAIGAMLGAVFLEILPHAILLSHTPQMATGMVLLGILLFFTLEKLVLWRHCHGDHCEVHAPHDEAHCPDNSPVVRQAHHERNNIDTVRPELVEGQSNSAPEAKYKAASRPVSSVIKAAHSHAHDHGRSGMMIMIGDTFHNFVDGVLIASAFVVDVKLGIVTALAIIAHEIPQEVGDFLILLHSGYSKRKALWFNLGSSAATLVGGVLAYYFLQQMQVIAPYVLSLAAASLLYVSVADLIPSLHKRTELKSTISQLLLIGLGVASIAVVGAVLG
jgi:zinc and cadmium transporter